ncbi:MAG: hypothetical protein KGJ34_01025 [Patescibacteria group bacterium]|nr:hypothetical protein [Patescibacteria group bacterium]
MNNCNIQYNPLEPLSSPLGGQINYSDFASYLKYIFPILISLGALVGVVSLTVGGVLYMTSSVPGVKSEALGRAQASIWGLLLLIASVLILQTINPNLISFNLSDLNTLTQQAGSSSGSASTQQTNTNSTCTVGQTGCSSLPSSNGGSATELHITVTIPQTETLDSQNPDTATVAKQYAQDCQQEGKTFSSEAASDGSFNFILHCN